MGSKHNPEPVVETVLPDHVRAFIVTRHAVLDDYDEIRELVKDRFGITDIPSIQLTFLNPRTKSGRDRISAEHMELYERTHDAFKRGLIDVGVMYKAYRLRRLDEMERAARKDRKFSLAKELLRQAAEEVGGVFDKSKNGLDLDTLREYVDKLALAVVQNVKDPEALRRIEESWGKLDSGEETVGDRIRGEWGV